MRRPPHRPRSFISYTPLFEVCYSLTCYGMLPFADVPGMTYHIDSRWRTRTRWNVSSNGRTLQNPNQKELHYLHDTRINRTRRWLFFKRKCWSSSTRLPGSIPPFAVTTFHGKVQQKKTKKSGTFANNDEFFVPSLCYFIRSSFLFFSFFVVVAVVTLDTQAILDARTKVRIYMMGLVT